MKLCDSLKKPQSAWAKLIVHPECDQFRKLNEQRMKQLGIKLTHN